MNTIQLFCLPFAGGNRYSYRRYEDHAPAGIKVVPLEYPGRGARMNEPLIKDIAQLTNDLYARLCRLVGSQPYAIYGHSMGGIVAYLLCRKIIASGQLPLPEHLFVSGSMAPACQHQDAVNRHLLPKEEFIEEMRRLDGCPEEILLNPELLDYFEPMLRADFEAAETFRYEALPPMDIPITALHGSEEGISVEASQLWQRETTVPIEFRRLPGKHFFIYQYPREILQLMATKLLSTIKNSSI